MSPLVAVVVILLLALPLHLAVRHEFAKLADPAYLRRHGVVIVSARALEARGVPIGEYQGQPIWASVTFMGMVYRFDRVAQQDAREKTGPGELFLDPGLVYITD